MPTPNPFQGDEAFSKALQDVYKNVKSKLSTEDIMRNIPPDQLAKIVERIGKNKWVVVSKDGRSVAKDPATGYPFSHNNKKFAELVAKEIGGHAIPWGDALRVLSDKAKSDRS